MTNGKNDKLDEIMKSIKNRESGQSAEEFLLSQLNEEQSKKLKSIISDDESVKRFLESEQAKKIIQQMLGKGQQDG